MATVLVAVLLMAFLITVCFLGFMNAIRLWFCIIALIGLIAAGLNGGVWAVIAIILISSLVYCTWYNLRK